MLTLNLVYNKLLEKMKTTVKKIILSTLCVASLFGCTQKRPEVIERPVFDVWNSRTLEIDKIEMSDSATVFYIDAYLRPNARIKISKETHIRKSGTNEKLLITQAEGIILDEETIIPELGTMSFKLFFPPLKSGITKIDFIESNYKIWGIHLLPNAKIKFDPIPKDVAQTSTEPLPKPEYSLQPARVSGRLLGYGKGMEHSNITITALNPLYFKRTETILSIAEDGSFNGEIISGLPGIYQSSVGHLFLTPDKETKLYIDLKKRSRYESRYRTDKEPSDSIYAYVSGGLTFAELQAINEATDYFYNRRGLLFQDIVNMYNPEEFKQYMLGVLNNKLDEIRQKGYSANMQMMMENAMKIDMYILMMQHQGLIIAAKRALNNITTSEEFIKMRDEIMSSVERPGAEYYSYLKGELNDNMSYLPNFVSLVETLNDFIDVFRLPGGRRDNPAKERVANFKEKYVSIIGTDKGILYDMVQAMHYGWQLAEMKYFSDIEKQEIQDLFKDKPIYAEVLIAESDRMELVINATKENNESIMNELPDVSQEQMLDAIIAKYKNKVVVVDIWGTWCGSCLVAIKTIQPLKDEMKEKDVVWLYIADGTSPLGTWKQTYPAISGEHYYVNKALTNYWGINAYPTYMVYDRQGKQLAKYVDFPGIDVMKNIIEKGL